MTKKAMLFYPPRSDALFSNYFEEDLFTKWLPADLEKIIA